MGLSVKFDEKEGALYIIFEEPYEADPEKRWHPEYGNSYFLGFHHGNIFNNEEVYATFMGIQDGKFVFFRENWGKVFRYTASPEAPARWMSDGYDDPSVPYVDSGFDQELPDGPHKDYVLKILRKHNHVTEAMEIWRQNSLQELPF